MSTEGRFVLALALMFGVIWGTNRLFPPILPDLEVSADSSSIEGLASSGAGAPASDADVVTSLSTPQRLGSLTAPSPEAEPQTSRQVSVETPLGNWQFDTRGAQLSQVRLLRYASLREGDGIVHLLNEGASALEKRLVVGSDTLDLSQLTFDVQPAAGLRLTEPGETGELRFLWSTPDSAAQITFVYGFDADDYLISVQSEVQGLSRPLLLESLGSGLAFSEADSAQEAKTMAWVGNHVNEGIDAVELAKVSEPRLREGPFGWVGVKNKYFLLAVLPGSGEEQTEGAERYLGGVITTPGAERGRPSIVVSLAYDNTGSNRYRIYSGPQEYSRLEALGQDLEEVNPYGWKWLRPVIRPFVIATLWVLDFLHDRLSVGYGWVLVIFGVLMRIVLWPLNQKAMRAQMRNMAVQPMVKEVQAKYKDNPERLQKEMLRLYKEYGFNPLGGCLPMLIPWPVLIALFFVFQNTIELRGVSFLWLPDLSAKDPIYLLPLFMAVSMFALQWISFRSMPDQGNNPQMKMMMYFMPIFFGFIFMQFPSGLNLYYAVTNIATIPQQLLIARERKAAAARGPVRVDKSG